MEGRKVTDVMREKRRIPVQEILYFLEEDKEEFTYEGKEIEIFSFSNITDITDNTIVWVKNATYLTKKVQEDIQSHKEILVISTEKAPCMENCIITPYPKAIYFSILSHFFVKKREYAISEKAVVLTDKIGRNVNIGPGCYIGSEVEIGDDVYIHPNVTIEGYCHIGDRTEISSGVVIGMEGYGYYRKRGIPKKVPHFMGVEIGTDVEIGPNTCIAKGCLGHTVIGNRVKIDSLCVIGHNVQLDDCCMVVAGSIVCGSAHLGERVYLAPGTVIMNQLKIDKEAFVGLGSVVNKPVEAGKFVLGVPARVVRDVRDSDY